MTLRYRHGPSLHFDGYRAVLIRLPQVTGAALREAITNGWLVCAPPRLARDFFVG